MERANRIKAFLEQNPVLKISTIEKDLGLCNGRINNLISPSFIEPLENYLQKYGYEKEV